MSYVESNLMDGEKVAFKTKLHWKTFIVPELLLTLCLVGVAASLIHRSKTGLAASGACAAAAALWSLSKVMHVASSEFAVTNKRLIMKVGLLHRHTLETPLATIETVSVDQDLLGQALGYGTIVVSGTGGTKETFANIARPSEFSRQVEAQISGRA